MSSVNTSTANDGREDRTVATKPKFEIAVEGASKVTLLKLNGDPIARFYAGRFDQKLLDQILFSLNGEMGALHLLREIEDHARSPITHGTVGQAHVAEGQALRQRIQALLVEQGA
jgi:hypothetical protein